MKAIARFLNKFSLFSDKKCFKQTFLIFLLTLPNYYRQGERLVNFQCNFSIPLRSFAQYPVNQ